ncbi:GEVED domain-containing protein [Niabella pedocola]|uniref:GEVED domain-containing protein n=1 Tax=Niabella pedocola TaxID=1752077 RepID=A0ABS8PJH7_9BACT|nr:GEVED domain-containing protein [Niabella pedocola]MCD2421235.1 GEVED domain-containing protein [Niabella pedocola]
MRAKTYLLVVLLYAALGSYAQTVAGVSDIGTGYYNGHIFATFNNITGTPPVLTGSLGSNPFTINFSGNTHPLLFLSGNYGPNRPSNSGDFSVPTVELDYSQVPATSTITFTNTLQPLDQMTVIDIDNEESVVFEFLNAAGNPVPVAGNVRALSISSMSPSSSLNFPDATSIAVNTDPGKSNDNLADQGFAFVMLTNVVKTIRFTQTAPSVSGSWNFTFSKGTPDFGDAPVSYGNAMHLPLAAMLKMGANGPDAEATSSANATASGDDVVSGSTVIDDEDGVTSIPAIINTGLKGQVIPTYTITTTVTNNTGMSANVVAWIDWNGNGTFEASEAATVSSVPTGSNNVSRTFTWSNQILTGATGATRTYLRIRTTTNALTSGMPTGFATDGEVEDYAIPFTIALPVQFGDLSAVSKNHSLSVNWSTLTESNTDHFEIEGSKDGVHFKKIATVGSKAAGGNASGKLTYAYETDFDTATAVLFGFPALLALSLISMRRRYKIFVTSLLIGCITIVHGCSDKEIADIDNSDLFIRIVQVDKDGGRTTSNVVKVVKE